MPSRLAIAATLAIGAGLVSSCAPTSEPNSTLAHVQNRARCETASALGGLGSAASAKWVEADGALPAFCEVTAMLSPEQGSEIGVLYRLPASWNGKMLGLGGGGWAGNVTLDAAKPGLTAGYATAQTDGGHASTAPFENAWVVDPVKVKDFSWRAIHEMTVAGKALVAAYYGKGLDRSYFHGCSTGGRMALMEAQRFPSDYDAIIAQAPVYTLQVQTSAVLRNNLFAQPGAALGAEGAKLVSDAVLKSCDAKDGVADGVIADPRSCHWKPAELLCKPGASGGCLTQPQVNALNVAYDGVRAADGSFAQLPLSRGGEAGWAAFVAINGDRKEFSNGGGTGGLVPVLWGGRQVDLNALTPAQVVEGRASGFAKMYEAGDPNLSPFFARGGKLLMWHGESDPGPSPVGTIDYVEAVKRADPAGAAKGLQLFLAPGVGHCAGGPGADQVDVLGALDGWVKGGKAPQTLVAKKADGSMVRPLCAWPKVAHYTGKGNANDPKNYNCIARD